MQGSAEIFFRSVYSLTVKNKSVYKDIHFGEWSVSKIPKALPYFAHML